MSRFAQHTRVSAPLLDADDPALFPKLTEPQIELLSRRGEVRQTTRGQVLFRQGNPTYDVMVVLEGSVSVVVGSGDEAGSILAIPGADFRDLVGRHLTFGDFVLQTLFRRRQAPEHLAGTPSR